MQTAYRGHMWLLIPPGLAKGADLPRAPDRDMGFAQIYVAGWEAHLLAKVGDPPSVLAKALEACPRCPSASLDFHSWRTGLETYTFGRAPLPEFKICLNSKSALSRFALSKPMTSTTRK